MKTPEQIAEDCADTIRWDTHDRAVVTEGAIRHLIRDAIEADRAQRERGPAGTERVVFHWTREWGDCYECGLPAAFFLPDAYGVEDEAPSRHNLRCAVCAANAAAEGERVARIDASLAEEERA